MSALGKAIGHPSLARRISHRTRELRRTLGLTQGDLAERVAVEPTYISRIEAAERIPSVPTLIALAGALGCSVDTLVGEL